MENKHKKEKNVTFTVRIPSSLKKLIDKNALKEGRSSANLGAFYLRIGIKKREQIEELI